MKYLLIFMAMLSMEVFAAIPTETGTITQMLAHRNPSNLADSGRRFIVNLSGTLTDGPCNSNVGWTGYFSDEVGRAHYATLLAAVSNRAVKLEGTADTCESGSAVIRNVYIVY